MENIKRGQIYYAKLPIYRSGHQVIKPVLIIQNNKYNEICEEVLIIPINKRLNNKVNNDMKLELDEFKKIMPNSIFLLNKIMSIKKKNINGLITELDKKTIKLIDKNLREIIDL